MSKISSKDIFKMNFVNVRVCSVEPAIVNIGSKKLIPFFHNLTEAIDLFHAMLSTYQISSQNSRCMHLENPTALAALWPRRAIYSASRSFRGNLQQKVKSYT